MHSEKMTDIDLFVTAWLPLRLHEMLVFVPYQMIDIFFVVFDRRLWVAQYNDDDEMNLHA